MRIAPRDCPNACSRATALVFTTARLGSAAVFGECLGRRMEQDAIRRCGSVAIR